MVNKLDLEDVELDCLITAIYLRWGYDFRGYASESFKRRVLRIVAMKKLKSISALQELLLRDSIAMKSFCNEVLVGVTSMFRDPAFFRAFRSVAIPILKEKEVLRIWHAGCASGEEVYSMSILLFEEGLLSRTQIYATDLNEVALEKAKEGLYSSAKLKEFEKSYMAFGGKNVFADYFEQKDYRHGQNYFTLRSDLRKNIAWAQHNLVTDASFNEFDLILCRNVLFYFNAQLQEQVHALFHQSLTENGLLVLGNHESLIHSQSKSKYDALDRREKIFRHRSMTG